MDFETVKTARLASREFRGVEICPIFGVFEVLMDGEAGRTPLAFTLLKARCGWQWAICERCAAIQYNPPTVCVHAACER